MQETATLADYVIMSGFPDFPDAVVEKAIDCIIDSVGCAIGGSQTTEGRRYLSLARKLAGNRESTLIGDGSMVSTISGGYTNTQLGNLLDFDDDLLRPYTGLHPGGPIVHSALAVGEATRASGEELLSAVIMGYETSLRVADAISCTCEINGIRDVLMNSGHKVIGAAVTAGRLIGLSKEQLMNALGIAGCSVPGTAPGTSRQTGHQAMVAYSLKGNFGQYSMIGILSALQAREGITAPPGILDGSLFWKKCGALSCNHAQLTRNLGSEYEIMKIGFKPAPCCRWIHGAITAVWSALGRRSVDPGEITEILLVGTAGQQQYEWGDMLEAEFSSPCAVAMAIAGGEPGPEWYTSGRFRDDDIRELAKKVRFVHDSDADEAFLESGLVHCTARITIEGGAVFEGECIHMKGEPENPLTRAELERKFLANSRAVLGEERSMRLTTTLACIAELEDLDPVVALLQPKSECGGL